MGHSSGDLDSGDRHRRLRRRSEGADRQHRPSPADRGQARARSDDVNARADSDPARERPAADAYGVTGARRVDGRLHRLVATRSHVRRTAPGDERAVPLRRRGRRRSDERDEAEECDAHELHASSLLSVWWSGRVGRVVTFRAPSQARCPMRWYASVGGCRCRLRASRTGPRSRRPLQRRTRSSAHRPNRRPRAPACRP